MLIELWHFNSKKLSRRFLLYVFDWDESSKWRRKQWKHVLELETYIIDARGNSYGSLGECHMWRTVLGESGIHFGWHHEGRKSYGSKTILDGESDPRRHHRMAAIRKCHYKFLVSLFWLQFSRILLFEQQQKII